jgi:hypothetical protein
MLGQVRVRVRAQVALQLVQALLLPALMPVCFWAAA